jgi:hypothetical protein
MAAWVMKATCIEKLFFLRGRNARKHHAHRAHAGIGRLGARSSTGGMVQRDDAHVAHGFGRQMDSTRQCWGAGCR